MKDRHTKIIELVSEREKIEVNELAALMQISKVTIRKDLDLLASKGLLRRERGYAHLVNPDDINYHMAFAFDRKQRITLAALEQVNDEETVILESGSCCAFLAEQIAKHRKNVTILTNSAFLASYVHSDQVKIILFGGEYQPRFQSMVGPLVKQCVRNYHVDKIFVSTDGFSMEHGFMSNDMRRVETVLAMAESADKIILMAESEKFSRTGTTNYLTPEDVSMVITDSLIPDHTKNYLEQFSLELKIIE